MKKYPFYHLLSILLVLTMAFFAGRGMADFAEGIQSGNRAEAGSNAAGDPKAAREKATETSGGVAIGSGGMLIENSGRSVESGACLWPFDYDHPMLPGTENWGLGFGEQGQKPTGNAPVSEMKEYHAYYMAEGAEKRIYLTFDCGYENGNTEAILDALKKHHAPAAFFVVGHFLQSAPELVKRMVEEGHAVGNHTFHHPDMSKISDRDAFQKEMDDVRALFHEVTGQEMPMYYRPPQGKYNIQNLQMAKDLGYSTFFWSLAYVDWNVESQPTHEEAFSKLTTRIHPGAIVLMHNTSKTNGEIMDELLTRWEDMGYTFGTLEELLK